MGVRDGARLIEREDDLAVLEASPVKDRSRNLEFSGWLAMAAAIEHAALAGAGKK